MAASFMAKDLESHREYGVQIARELALGMAEATFRPDIIYVASDNRPRHLWSVACGLRSVVCGLVFDT